MGIITRGNGKQEETNLLSYDKLKHLQKTYEKIVSDKWNIDDEGLTRVIKNLDIVKDELELR